MKFLNFNIEGFIAPQNIHEYISLLDEAFRMADELNGMLDRDTDLMESSAKSTTH